MATALYPSMAASTNGSADVPWQQNLNMTLMCPDCREMPPNLIEEFSSGDMVCGSCGLVLGDRIVDTRSEWRTFSNDDQGNDDPSRVGEAANDLIPGSQLQTKISADGGSGRSRDLSRTQNKILHDKASKGLMAAYKEIGAYCDAVGISKQVSDLAKHLYRLVDDAKAFKGKPQDALQAGCIFIACRQCGVPRTFKEVFALTKVPKKEVGNIFKKLEKFFSAQSREKMAQAVQNGGIVNPKDDFTATASTKAQQLCLRYCNQLGLSNRTTKVCGELAEKMSRVGALAGRSPLSAAAACIYMTSYLMKQPKTAKEISAVAGVSDGTIRTAYKFLYAEREKLIEPEWIQDGKGDMKLLPPS
ncbi:MAG: transcription initiation factor IIB [Piccolia ochrophora]|nr:MAG: transcription initiation factor IIB [Piccolia ochrophora]